MQLVHQWIDFLLAENAVLASFNRIAQDKAIQTFAEKDTEQKENHIRDLMFGLLDIRIAIFFFLPLFGQKTNGIIREVSLLSLSEISSYLRTAYFIFTIGIIIVGGLYLWTDTKAGKKWLENL